MTIFGKSIKILIVMVSFYSLVLAQEPKSDTKQQIIEEYKQALNFFKLKKYQESYDILNKLFEQNLNSVNISFYLGRSAFELKKYHESIIAFETVLFNQPDSPRTKLEIARAYFMAGEFQQSKEYFVQIKNDKDTPENITAIVDKYLEVIDSKDKKNFLSGLLVIGINYDSNVNNRSSYDYFNIPTLSISLTNTTEDESDWAHQEVGIINHKYKINDNTFWKNDLLAFAKTMKSDRTKDKNLKMVSYKPSISHQYAKGFEMDYAVFADKVILDGRSYQESYGLFPSMTYLLNDKLITSAAVKYQIKKYQQPQDKQNNSTLIELTNNWKYIYDKKTIYSLTGIVAKEKIKNFTANNGVDSKSLQAKFDVTYILNDKISLIPGVSYKYTKYEEEDFLWNKRRSDNEYKLMMTGSYAYDKTNVFQMILDYTDNQSNLQQNEYDKYTFTLNYIKAF